ncbi:DUF397 domain-containing protein [Nocardia vinacea]|uniref:DUF397 domain-containing protein n=1 Tax=Nocardia vinacea TaxID=96468 RepID=UPI003F4CE2C7
MSSAKWFKSSGANVECVEVAFLDGGMVGVRDSKNPTGPALVFTPGEWSAFTVGVNDGEFECSSPVVVGDKRVRVGQCESSRRTRTVTRPRSSRCASA